MYGMINAHPLLSARTKVQHFHKQVFDLETGSMYAALRTKVQHFHKQVFDLETGSMYAALSREANTKMGLNPSFMIYDEYGQSPRRR